MKLDKELEQAMKPLLADFALFLEFLQKRDQIPLTKTKGQLKTAELFALNEQMNFKYPWATPKTSQDKYPLLQLFFHLSVVADIALYTEVKEGAFLRPVQETIAKYGQLNEYEKYFFLLECFWLRMQWSSLDSYSSGLAYHREVKSTAEMMKGAEPEKWYPVSKSYLSIGERQFYLRNNSLAFYILSVFGFYQFEYTETINKSNPHEIPVKAVKFADLGKVFMEVLINNFEPERDNFYAQFEESPLEMDMGWLFNLDEDQPGEEAEQEEEETESQEDDEKNKLPLIEPFLPYFSPGLFSNTIPVAEAGFQPGTYILKVGLDKRYYEKELHKVYRVIALDANHTLHKLHLAIQKAFEFDNDHLYAFYLDKAEQVAIYHPEYGDGASADESQIGILRLQPGMTFFYLFDFGDDWRFTIEVEEIKEDKKPLKAPQIVKSVGKAPEQYPDEEEWDEEDEDKADN